MPQKAHVAGLASFQQQLIGTWTNQNLPGTGKGDRNDPYSYNVTPLPQDSSHNDRRNPGYVLKNFKYYEKIVFHGPEDVLGPVGAPNRGGKYQQHPYALFYDKQIRFAEGPGIATINHEENGAWLHLVTEDQYVGPYLNPPEKPIYESGPVEMQPSGQTICQQISVPHGISVMALGKFERPRSGEPRPAHDRVPVHPVPYDPENAHPLDTAPYDHTLNHPDNYQNPHEDLTRSVNKPLQDAIDDLRKAGHGVTNYIHFEVDTENGGMVANIPFEDRKAALSRYRASCWLLSYDGGMDFDILAYLQQIDLIIEVAGAKYLFRHPSCNVLTRLSVV
jgi:hypothetical protein